MSTITSAEHAAPAKAKKRVKTPLFPYLMILPSLFFLALFIIGPMFQTLFYSLYEFGPTSPTKWFVGLKNFTRLWNDPVFWLSLKNNLVIIVISLVFQVCTGTALAAMLDRGVRTGSTFFRTVIFAPIVMSPVAVALLWGLVYNPIVGLGKVVFDFFNMTAPPLGFLGDPDLALYSIMAAYCWQFTGFIMVIMLAGMQSVDEDLYKAAHLDGCKGIRAFFYITLPNVKNVLMVSCLLTLIGAFKTFDLIKVLTNGGPGNSTQVLATYIYESAFDVYEMGYANAISVILLAIALVLGFIQLRYSRGTK